MLRTTLDDIVEMARSEGKKSTNTSRGVDHLEHIKQLVRRIYNNLLDEFDWKHLKIKREDCFKTMSAGSRYYDWPTTLNVNKIEKVWFLWGNTWVPLQEGITYDQYNIKNSENDERSDPVDRFAWYGDSQFEVWPKPASSGGKVGFQAQKKGELLTGGTNRADLDDIMLALYAGAELLLEGGDEKMAQAKIAMANRRRGTMIAAAAVSSRVRLGGNDPKMGPQQHGIDIQFIRKSS